LSITPSDELVFNYIPSKNITTTLLLYNPSECKVAFKVKQKRKLRKSLAPTI
jgi:hypothetical protein